MSKNIRRDFLQKMLIGSGALLAAPTFGFSNEQTQLEYLTRSFNPTEDREINVALIGAGTMGAVNTNTILKHHGIKLVAVCDLYKGRLKLAQDTWGPGLFLTMKYKEILKRQDVEAVIIATPDHWHKQISIDALKAGKHVYCEKPMVHSVDEGHELINAWQKAGKIFMVGSQGLSSLGNEKAKQLLAEGAIGELNYAEGFWARHSPIGAWQYVIPNDASLDTVDWETFVSNTTKREFDPIRFFRWRNYLDYGTGMSGDLFVHLFSSLHFITNSIGPNKISAMGGLRYWKDGREVPDVLLGMFQYPETKEHPGFNLSLRCNFVDGTSGSTYLKIVGSEGSMDIGWDDVILKRNDVSTDDSFEKAKMEERGTAISDRKKILPPQVITYKAEEGYQGAHYDHHGNFIKAIRTNTPVVEDPIFGFRAAAPALLCNNSYFQDRFEEWDPMAMKVKS